MQHQGDVLAAFQDGETRLIYARPRSGGDLWMLLDGEAAAHRARTKAELACPVPSCPDPDLTTVARKEKRDGFRHLSGGGHAPESLFHLQGKQRIADWLRANYPAATVNIEEQSDTNRTRIADVMFTEPTKKRIAFEIQYSPISAEKWRERHDSYLKQGITDIWLWGHYGANLRANGRSDIMLTPAQQLVAKLGEPLLWFNPMLGEIGMASEVQYQPKTPVETLPERGSGRFAIEPLDAFSIDTGGFGSAHTRRLLVHTQQFRDWKSQVEAARRADEEREGAHRAAVSAMQRAAAENYARGAAERAARIAELRRRAEAAWRGSAAREETLKRLGGTWPEWLNIEVENPPIVPAEQWQSAVYLKHILPVPHSNQIRRAPIIDWLQKEYRIAAGSRKMTMLALFHWLDALAKRGIVWRRDTGSGYKRRITFYAVDPAYLDPEKWLEGVERPVSRRLELERRLAQRREERAAQPPAPSVPAPAEIDSEEPIRLAREAALAQPQASFGKAVGTCRVCRYPLDPILADLGGHIGCVE